MPDVFITPQQKEETPLPQKTGVVNEHHIHSLASFCQNPQGVSFDTQDADEDILLFLRRDFVTNMPWISLGIILLILPLILKGILVLPPFLAFLSGQALSLLVIFYYLAVFIYLFINFLTWSYNISLVTNKRVVDIDFSDLVYRNLSATKLNLVQDVSYSQTGVIRSVFDYGDVLVQTAGTIDNFDLMAVPSPGKVVYIIENLIGKGPNA